MQQNLIYTWCRHGWYNNPNIKVANAVPLMDYEHTGFCEKVSWFWGYHNTNRLLFIQQGAAIALFNFYTVPISQMGLRTDFTEALIIIKCTVALRTDSTEALVTFSIADVRRWLYCSLNKTSHCSQNDAVRSSLNGISHWRVGRCYFSISHGSPITVDSTVALT